MRIFTISLLCALACACGEAPKEERDGLGDAPVLGARGEACEAPMPVALGARAYASLTDAAADVELSCASAALPDRVFTVSVPEDGVLSARLDTESALGIAVFSDGACDGADEVACSADAVWDGAVSAPVTAGTWLVVVKGESDERFALDVDLLPSACEGDGLDSIPLSGLFPGNPIAGDASTGVIDQDPETPDRQTGPMRLCPGDVDGFYFAHLGGSLTIDAEDAPWVLRPVTINVENFGNPYQPSFIRMGNDLDYAAIAEDAPPGYYAVYLRTDDTTAEDPLEYTLTIQHECSGDREDSPVPEIDDGTTAYSLLLARRNYTGDRESATYSICRGDTDAFILSPIATGVIDVGLGNLEDLTTDVLFHPFSPAAGAPAPDPIPVDAERVFADVGNKLVVPVDRLDGRYVVRIGLLNEQPATLRYGMSLTFHYDPPENPTCETATPLAPTEVEQSTTGTNAGAADVVVGLCNGDANASADLRAPEVFYAVTVTEPMNLELAVRAVTQGFQGTASIYRLPDALCPADLADLVPVKRDGTDLLEAENPALAACGAERVRAALEVGSYVVVVEGRAGRETPVVAPSVGTFTLVQQTFPDGFPVAAACVDPPAFTLPAPGASITVPIPAPSPHELRASCGGNGDESALTFTADAVHTVTIRTGPPHDTVLAIALGACDGGAELACNDDRMGHTGFESEVTFETVPDAPIFVIVDKYGINTQTPADAFIEVTVAP